MCSIRRIRLWSCAVGLVLATALAAATSPVEAEVLYSNFGPGMSFHACDQLGLCGLDCWSPVDDNISVAGGGDCWPSGGPDGYTCVSWWSAQRLSVGYSHQFSPSVTATFTSARVALYLYKPDVGVRVLLHEAGADGLPGPVLEEIWLRGMQSGVHTATSAHHPRLDAGHSYWLSVLPAPLSSYPNCVSGGALGCGGWARWCQNPIGDLDAGNVAESRAGGPWTSTNGAAASTSPRSRGAFQIEGDTAVTVAIDIHPGSVPNSVNPRSNGVVPVAVLSSEDFDVATVEPNTVRFGRTGTEAAPAQHALEHLNDDGYVDMIFHFRTQETGIACGTTSAAMKGRTSSGQSFSGTDQVDTVGCK